MLDRRANGRIERIPRRLSTQPTPSRHPIRQEIQLSSFLDTRRVPAYGVDKFDAEHAALMDIANRLFDGIQQHRAVQTLRSLLSEMAEHCERHFQHEESCFHVLHDAKAASAHLADHNILRERLSTIQSDFAERPSASHSLRTLVVVRDYLLQHIKTFDAALQARIVAAPAGTRAGAQMPRQISPVARTASAAP